MHYFEVNIQWIVDGEIYWCWLIIDIDDHLNVP